MPVSLAYPTQEPWHLARRKHDTWHYDVPVDPIRDIECPVCAEGSEVVGGDGLRFAGPLEEEELREDGHGLEEDGEGPQEFGEGEPVVEDEGQEDAGAEEVFDAERVY